MGKFGSVALSAHMGTSWFGTKQNQAGNCHKTGDAKLCEAHINQKVLPSPLICAGVILLTCTTALDLARRWRKKGQQLPSPPGNATAVPGWCVFLMYFIVVLTSSKNCSGLHEQKTGAHGRCYISHDPMPEFLSIEKCIPSMSRFLIVRNTGPSFWHTSLPTQHYGGGFLQVIGPSLDILWPACGIAGTIPA